MVKDLLECILITILGQERRTKIHFIWFFKRDGSKYWRISSGLVSCYQPFFYSELVGLSHYHFLAGSKSIYVWISWWIHKIFRLLQDLPNSRLTNFPRKSITWWKGSSQCYKMAIYCTQGRSTLCQQSPCHIVHLVPKFFPSCLKVVSNLPQSYPKVVSKLHQS